MNEREGLERGAVLEFADRFNDTAGRVQIVFEAARQPPYADTLCRLDGRELYIEVGHIYGTQDEAKAALGRGTKAPPGDRSFIRTSMIPLDLRVLLPLNRLLQKKATKRYVGRPLWLLVRSGMPLWNQENFERHRERIDVPDTHPFDEIWLLCGPRAGFGALRLY